MPELVMHIEGDGCWPDLAERQGDVVAIKDDNPIEIATLRGGMQSGRASVMIRLNTPEGKIVLAESSLALFGAAVKGFESAAGVDPDTHTIVDEIEALQVILTSGLPVADGLPGNAVALLIADLQKFLGAVR
jgi:hypothetical protein